MVASPNDNNLHSIAFGAPIPGQSLTTPPKNMPFEHPPQFTKLKDAMHFLMDQFTEPFYMKQLLRMLDAGMPIEAVTRTILFTGFTAGKWTVDLAMLMYKPLMLSLIAIAHRAGLHDVPVVVPHTLVKKKLDDMKTFVTADEFKKYNNPQQEEEKPQAPVQELPKAGFMKRVA